MLYLRYCVCLTVVFALHETLPLSEPLHADAQDHRRSLFSLELLVELQTRGSCSVGTRRVNAQAELCGPRAFYLDEGVDFGFPAFCQRFDLHLADGAHVQVVHCGAASKT